MGDDISTADLQARVAALEAENRVLRDRVAAPPDTTAVAASTYTARKTGRWRPFVAVILIVLGCVLAPLAIVSGWARATLTDTDNFVATYAPLAKDPAVQAYVVAQTMDVVNKNIDVDSLTGEVIDGIKSLGVRPRVGEALDLLKAPAAQGIESIMQRGVETFVASDAFATAWQEALRVSHAQLTATLSNDPNALLKAQTDGTIGIEIGPIIAQIKQSLIDRGITVASRIPDVNRTIPIAQAENLPTAQVAYRAVVAGGTWLPWVALILLTAGVLVAKRRARTLIWAAVGLALGMIVLLTGFVTGRAVLLTTLPPSVVPSNVTTLLYDTVVTPMKDTATVTLVLAVVVAIVGWMFGPFAAPRRLRGLYLDGVASLRGSAESRGVTTGKVGDWLYAQRKVVQTVVGLGAAAALLLLRPLSIGEIIATLVVALIVLIVLSLVERPPTATSADQVDPVDRGGPAGDHPTGGDPTVPLPAGISGQ
ncbi:hypothetical protein [Microlunatus ginsengisoli]|uniref:Integral membrane protein n=1 Tax=Microlunatus ginsengisoli TaxID=363863 RepID=A0ABP7ATZ8_9ACTN